MNSTGLNTQVYLNTLIAAGDTVGRSGVNCKTHASIPCVSVTYRQAAILSYLSSTGKQLLRSEFELLQKLSGRAVTHTVCAATQRPYTEAVNSLAEFEELDCDGKHLLIDVSAQQLPHYLLVFQKHYDKAPLTTSACALIPESALKVAQPLLKGWVRMQTYARGTELYFHHDTRRVRGVPWRTHLYLKPRLLPDQAQTGPEPMSDEAPEQSVIRGEDDLTPANPDIDTPMTDSRADLDARDHPDEPAAGAPSKRELVFLFQGTLSGARSTILLDSGSTDDFVCPQLVEQLKLTVHPHAQPVSVQVAGNQQVPSLGYVNVRVHIQGYRGTVRLHVAELADQLHCVLGNCWMERHRAVLNWETRTASLRVNGKYCQLTPDHISGTALLYDAATRTASGEPSVSLLSYAQATSEIRAAKGMQDWLLVQVREDTEAATTAAPGTDAWLDAEVQKLKTKYGERLFQERLPHERFNSDPVSAIPLQPGTKPVVRPMFRYSPQEREEIEKQVAELLRSGLLEPCTSPYASCALIAPKWDEHHNIKGWRMAIDYRLLNKVTVRNNAPLPRIEDLLDAVSGASYFSALDMTAGFWQLRLTDEDKPKTAWRSPSGLYQWRVLPFGLCNAPAVFHSTIENLFKVPYAGPDGTAQPVTALGSFVLVYLDDILVFSNTAEDHLAHLDWVFNRFLDQGYFLNPKKCEFNKPEIRYLGHIVSRNGVSVDPAKVARVQAWPVPTTVKQVQSFLGLANYFRRFIRGYSVLAAPLSDLTRRTQSEWVWGHAQAASFEALKAALSSAPVLVTPDLQKPFEVVADASGVAVGAILLQDGRPVAYESRKLTPAQRNWPTHERELWAVVHALKTWRCYLQHTERPFTMYTDHNPNTFFSTQPRLSPRQARWQETLSYYNFDWKYLKGARNMADPLSRLAFPEPTVALLWCCLALRTASIRRLNPVGGEVEEAIPENLDDGKSTLQSTAEAIANPAVGKTLAAEESGCTGTSFEAALRQSYEKSVWLSNTLRDQPNLLRQGSDGLWRTQQSHLVIVEESQKQQLLQAVHDSVFSGHLGLTKTLTLLQRQFWWPGMKQSVQEYIRSCDQCQRNKSGNALPLGGLTPLQLPQGKWSSVSVDFITDLPETASTKYTSICVFVDRLTKMVHLAPTVKDLTAEGFAQLFVENVVRLHGMPAEIVSDRDKLFTSPFWTALSALFGTQRSMSTAFHPQSDGQTERVNRVLEDTLRHFVGPTQDDWDKLLPCAEFALNNAKHEATGMTPFKLNYGIDPRSPALAGILTEDTPRGSSARAAYSRISPDAELVPAAHKFTSDMQKCMQHVQLCLKAAQQRAKAIADKRRTTEVPFAVGHQVLLKVDHLNLKQMGSRKLSARAIGPFPIVAKIGAVAFRLELPAKMKCHPVFHASQLKPYTPGRTPPPPPPEVGPDGELRYEVEMVVDHQLRRLGGRPKRLPDGSKEPRTRDEYLIKWRGYSAEHNSWEPVNYLENATEAIQEFWDRRKQHERPYGFKRVRRSAAA